MGGTRSRRIAGWVAVAAIALFLTFHVAGGWYFSSEINDRALSAASRRASLVPTYNGELTAMDATAATLSGSDARLKRDGVFGLRWEGGWGVVGSITGQPGTDTVVREFKLRSGIAPRVGQMVGLDTRVYPGNPKEGLGLAFEDVTVSGERGDYPAWYLPGRGENWYIFVHGNGMTRLDSLRILPALTQAQLPVLVPTYRGEEGAPEDPSGRLSYGKNEWKDLESAVQYALDHGASSVVLQGVSMGGGVVVAFLLESPLASQVTGVVLDAPLLDLERTVEFQAAREEIPVLGLPLPGTLIWTVEQLARIRFGVDWDYPQYLARADQLKAPMFLIHGDADRTVPLTTSRDLAASGRISFVTCILADDLLFESRRA